MQIPADTCTYVLNKFSYLCIACMCKYVTMCRYCMYVQVLQVCAGMPLCAGIACMFRYFQISIWHISEHTYTYLHIVTYLHTVAHTECHYVVGLSLCAGMYRYVVLRYLQI
jgi:hypothetical protein